MNFEHHALGALCALLEDRDVAREFAEDADLLDVLEECDSDLTLTRQEVAELNFTAFECSTEGNRALLDRARSLIVQGTSDQLRVSMSMTRLRVTTMSSPKTLSMRQSASLSTQSRGIRVGKISDAGSHKVGGKETQMYDITVETPECSRECRKRYSEFAALRKLLLAKYPTALFPRSAAALGALPPFPQQTWTRYSSKTSAIVQIRCTELTNWMNGVLQFISQEEAMEFFS